MTCIRRLVCIETRAYAHAGCMWHALVHSAQITHSAPLSEPKPPPCPLRFTEGRSDCPHAPPASPVTWPPWRCPITSHFYTPHIGLQWGRPVEAENTSRMPQALVRGQGRGGPASPRFAVGTTRRCSECAVAKLFFYEDRGWPSAMAEAHQGRAKLVAENPLETPGSGLRE